MIDHESKPFLKIERLAFYSDSVLAISMTLLVLGLEVPSVHKVPEKQLLHYLIDSIPSVLGYVSSFILVGIYWLQHYVMFHYLTRATRTLAILNGLFLLAVSIVPFPTGLHVVYRNDEYALVLFGAIHVICGSALLAIWIYATRGHRLIRATLSPAIVRDMAVRIALIPAVSLAAIGISFFDVWAGKMLFLILPLAYVSHSLVDSGWYETHENAGREPVLGPEQPSIVGRVQLYEAANDCENIPMAYEVAYSRDQGV